MTGFYISDCRNSDYNDVAFIYYVGGEANKISKGGKYYHIWYTKNENESRKFSAAQINQNYCNAVVKVNGKALDDRKTMFSASINGKEVYIQVNTAANSTDSKSYNIEILELELMQQNIAIDLNEAIGKDGKINVSRLKSEGVGSLCPVTSNTTVEGKALNRRVEIVNQ